MVVLTDLSARGKRCRRIPLFATLLLELCDALFSTTYPDNIKTIMLDLHQCTSLRLSRLESLIQYHCAIIFPQ
jgi:hypothetical protein